MHIGTGFQQIAVSPSGKYLAALRDSVLYTAPMGDPLVKRGSGYLTISWDISDQLWASTQTQIFMLRGAANPQQPLGQPVPVKVTRPRRAGAGRTVHIAAGRAGRRPGSPHQRGRRAAVRRDRRAAGGPAARPGEHHDHALAGPGFPGQRLLHPGRADLVRVRFGDHADRCSGPAVTEYPVSGAPYTPIPADTDLQSITASYNHPLIASLPHGQMVEDRQPAAARGCRSTAEPCPPTPADRDRPASGTAENLLSKTSLYIRYTAVRH